VEIKANLLRVMLELLAVLPSMSCLGLLPCRDAENYAVDPHDLDAGLGFGLVGLEVLLIDPVEEILKI
jgi:hypothetical protein